MPFPIHQIRNSHRIFIIAGNVDTTSGFRIAPPDSFRTCPGGICKNVIRVVIGKYGNIDFIHTLPVNPRSLPQILTDKPHAFPHIFIKLFRPLLSHELREMLMPACFSLLFIIGKTAQRRCRRHYLEAFGMGITDFLSGCYVFLA